eukprot:370313-Prorocentrum_lima.AAC.1
MQLVAEQPPDEKDRFLILGLAPEDSSIFYPWLVRANHGHGIKLNWSRMFTKVTVEMVKCMRDVVHQTKEEAIPGILEHGFHCSMSLKRNPFKTMVHMLPFAPESGLLRTGYIDPSKGYVSVIVDLAALIEEFTSH